MDYVGLRLGPTSACTFGKSSGTELNITPKVTMAKEDYLCLRAAGGLCWWLAVLLPLLSHDRLRYSGPCLSCKTRCALACAAGLLHQSSNLYPSQQQPVRDKAVFDSGNLLQAPSSQLRASEHLVEAKADRLTRESMHAMLDAGHVVGGGYVVAAIGTNSGDRRLGNACWLFHWYL